MKSAFQKYRANHPHDPYKASPDLAAAVNTAIAIGRPLLLAGEPGTGKTAMAASIALQLSLGPVLRFDTHGDSRWQDCLYAYDALTRLYDANAQREDAANAVKYRRFTALGEAICSATQRVVLIDEVDKAPRDFPNGLLAAMDRDMQFTIAETQEVVVRPADALRPIVIFTTNEERNLPDAFLRRCVFFNIEFPREELLVEIVRSRLAPEERRDYEELVLCAVSRLQQLRLEHAGKLAKPPATAELIDWVNVLIAAGKEANEVAALPHYETLLKTKEDVVTVLKRLASPARHSVPAPGGRAGAS